MQTTNIDIPNSTAAIIFCIVMALKFKLKVKPEKTNYHKSNFNAQPTPHKKFKYFN